MCKTLRNIADVMNNLKCHKEQTNFRLFPTEPGYKTSIYNTTPPLLTYKDGQAMTTLTQNIGSI